MVTAREIIQRGMVAVRNSATLYPRYQELFNEVFGYFPECPTCGSLLGQNQWKAFEAFANGADPTTLLTKNTTETMSKQTFKIKDKNRLYAYNFKKKDQDRIFTSRTYGDVMTEEFAINYLDSAAEDEELLNQRKAEFSELPAKYSKKDKIDVDPNTPVDLTKLKMVDLQAVAADKEYPAEEWEKLKSKAEVIAYLEAKALSIAPAFVGEVDPLIPTDISKEGVDTGDDLV